MCKFSSSILLAPLLAASLLAPSLAAKSGEYLMYVGTYTRNDSKGIYVYKFDTATGKATSIGLAAEYPNPSFVTIHPNRRFLYAVSEVDNYNGQKSGAVAAFSIDKTSGKLTKINEMSTKGTIPCHLVVDKTQRNLIVVNYGSGSTTVYPLNADGSLKEPSSFIQHQGSSTDRSRQQGPHAHSVNLSKDNRFAVVADLGLDEVKVYKFDAAAGKIEPGEVAKVKPGSGPRHFNFHPSQKYAYVINEMASTVTAFRYDKANGKLTEMQTLSTVPAGNTTRNSTAEVLVHPSGKFVYGSNRGHNSIAVFQVDRSNGKLTHVDNTPTQGKTPRNFAIDPSGKFLLAENQDSSTIVIFRIDQSTGKLTPTGDVLQQPIPVCIRFLPR
ncbi:MAG: lactonase family protein [Bryobacteraceae bacterium]